MKGYRGLVQLPRGHSWASMGSWPACWPSSADCLGFGGVWSGGNTTGGPTSGGLALRGSDAALVLGEQAG